MNCKDEISAGCKKKPARCVTYEGKHSSCSELGECDEYTLHETLEDVSEQLDKFCKELDLSEVDTECIDVSIPDRKLGNIVTALVEIVCKIKESLPEEGECPKVFSEDIACLGLDFKCLTDPCGEQPTNLKDLLQIIIDKKCE